MQHEPNKPAIKTGGAHDRAIDTAVEMLSIALRADAMSSPARRAALLRNRLVESSSPSLRDRVVSRSDRG